MASSTSILGEIKCLSTHSAVYGIAAMGSAGISMILVPLYVHLFTPEEFGQLQLVQLWLSILSTIAGLGLTTAYFKAYHQYDSIVERQDTLGMVLCLSLLGSIIGCGIILGFSLQSYTDHFSFLHDPSVLLLVLGCLVGSVLLGIPFQVLRVQEQSPRYLKLVGFGLFVNIVLSVAFVWWLSGGVKGVLAVQMSSATLMLLMVSPYLTSHMRMKLIRGRAMEILRFGIPLVPASIALWVLDASDRILLERFYGVFEVGVYALGQKYASILLMAIGAFQVAWAPYLFSIAKREDAPQLISRILTFFLTACMILATLLYVLGGEILSFVASEEYVGAQLVIAPLLLGFLFYGLYFVTISGVYLHGRTGAVAIVVGTAAILNIILNVLLIPHLGGVGAAWATAISYLALAGMMYLLSRKYLPKFCLECRPLAMAAISCMFVAMASDHIQLNGLVGWIMQFGGIALIPVILWFSGFVTPSERKQIQEFATGLVGAGNLR